MRLVRSVIAIAAAAAPAWGGTVQGFDRTALIDDVSAPVLDAFSEVLNGSAGLVRQYADNDSSDPLLLSSGVVLACSLLAIRVARHLPAAEVARMKFRQAAQAAVASWRIR